MDYLDKCLNTLVGEVFKTDEEKEELANFIGFTYGEGITVKGAQTINACLMELDYNYMIKETEVEYSNDEEEGILRHWKLMRLVDY